MLENLPLAALVGCLVAALLGSMGMRFAPHLDGKLLQLRRVLGIELVLLLVFTLALFIHRSTGLDGPDWVQPNQPPDATDFVMMKRMAEESLRQHTLHLAGLVVVLVCNLPLVLQVMRELQSFVLHHRTDLLARDQIAGDTMRG
jgi:hypothetical protein